METPIGTLFTEQSGAARYVTEPMVTEVYRMNQAGGRSADVKMLQVPSLSLSLSLCLSLSFSFALRCTLHMIVLDCAGQVDFIDHPTQLFQPNTSSPLRSITPPTVSSPLTFAVI